MSGVDQRSHGGNLRLLSEESGLEPGKILDFSANLNPLGPPPWLAEAASLGLAAAGRYPDPDSTRAREAAARRFGLRPADFVFADGADSIIHALPSALGSGAVVAFGPCYSGYARAASRAGARFVALPLEGDGGWRVDPGLLLRALDGLPKATVFLGAPNNPVGETLPIDALCDVASRARDAVFAIDESFAELAGRPEGCVGKLPPNCLVLRSLTKTWAMPGFRAGFASGDPDLLRRLRAELPAWPLSSFAEEASVLAMADRDWGARGAEAVAAARARLCGDLRAIDGLEVFPSEANFVFLRFREGLDAATVAARMLAGGIAIRTYTDAEGPGPRAARVAVRLPAENGRLVAAMRDAVEEAGR